ncbi:hypothetical protein AXE80_01105 [Wenyingzhuangia fucanilytica]|uniref:NAD-dependent epimerase/dehydratase domain-containing protein n=1 Tax=Wenyingzhuangia fucanilytica TaxID=1790137 RepID=A0A1B1Y2H7_9FLAO|nr:NAD-dependent epimerase/dehydratase family protein [Wenyingzhuangia fucanilytica]ANW94973.1 hypothetical protein AXE80_01105 [Wenyingzhuangia fucanilytica]
MKILITGSNGFLGSRFVSSYKDKFELLTLSRKNADICIDLGAGDELESIDTDIVIHAAGKAHTVPKTEAEKEEFFKVNLKGTQNLVRSLKNVKTFVFISTVAVYGVESGAKINEKHKLEGQTPYAKSKILTEKFLSEHCKENNINLLVLRLPLLAAENPPGNLGTMIRAMSHKRYLSINKGKAKRSVVLIEDIVNWLPSCFGKTGIYNLTDNDDPTFRELELTIANQLNITPPISLPLFVAKFLGFMGDMFRLSFINSDKINKMTNSLTFCSKKAIEELEWNPRKVKENFKIH